MVASVLFVDDHEGYSASMQSAFRLRNMDVDCVVDWSSALDRFRVCQYELVIADYNLPGSAHGLRLLEAIKELNPATRLVLISGEFTSDVRASVESIDVVDRFLEKGSPDTVGELLREVELATKRAAQPTDWWAVADAHRRRKDMSFHQLAVVDDELKELIVSNGDN